MCIIVPDLTKRPTVVDVHLQELRRVGGPVVGEAGDGGEVGDLVQGTVHAPPVAPMAHQPKHLHAELVLRG